jgi:hypothetical protein
MNIANATPSSSPMSRRLVWIAAGGLGAALCLLVLLLWGAAGPATIIDLITAWCF